MFQDGIIAQAVDTVKTSGVAYFSSAANSGRKSYASTYSPSSQLEPTYGGRLHDFDPGAAEDVYQTIALPGGPDPGITTAISFQWDEPYFSVSGSNIYLIIP